MDVEIDNLLLPLLGRFEFYLREAQIAVISTIAVAKKQKIDVGIVVLWRTLLKSAVEVDRRGAEVASA